MVRSGELLRSNGIVFLQMEFVLRLTRRLTDHRIGGRARGAGGRQVDVPTTTPLLLTEAINEAAGGRKRMLTEAVNAFCRQGELREELLPLLWQGAGVHKDEYPAALQMLIAAGQLVLAKRTLQERRWVVPARLPPARPQEATALWTKLHASPDIERLAIAYPIDSAAPPPGLLERLVAALAAAGEYAHYWRGGC
eukprot:548764-Prymnesium_polylepis.1